MSKDRGNDKKAQVNINKLNTTATRVVYWVFQVLIACTLGYAIVMAVLDRADEIALSVHLSHIMLCVVSLLLYNIPSFVQRKFRLYVPSWMHIFILVFIFAHFVLGEVFGAYTASAVFDKVLHATSGFAIALGGFSLVNILNNSRDTHLKLSPFFVAVFAFCFALAIALLWEIIEFASDSLFGTNMQRYIPPANVESSTPPKQGYGLVDTMVDVIVSTASAFVVCVGGYILLRKNRNFFNRFLLRKIPDYDTAIQEARASGDEKLAVALEKAKAAALEQIMSGPEEKNDRIDKGKKPRRQRRADKKAAKTEEQTPQTEQSDLNNESLEQAENTEEINESATQAELEEKDCEGEKTLSDTESAETDIINSNNETAE